MEIISNDYSINIQNDIMNRIKSLLDGNYMDVYKFDKNFLIALCLTYFGLSENELITTDKSNQDISTRHDSHIDYSYIRDFFNNNDIDFNKNNKYSSDKIALLSIIRNGLFHGMSIIDTKSEEVHLESNHNLNEIDTTIPFSFFENYLRSKLTDNISIDNNSFYLLTTFNNKERLVHSDYNSSSSNFLINNGILPLKITPKRKNNYNGTLENNDFQKFMYYFEMYFKSINKTNYTSFYDFYSEFKVLFEREFLNSFPDYTLDITIDVPSNIDKLLFDTQKNNLIHDSNELSFLLNRSIYSNKYSMYDLIPFLYKGLLKLRSANTALEQNFLGYNEDKYSVFDDAKEILSYIRVLDTNYEEVLTTLVTILGSNSMLINDDRFYREDNIYERLDLKFFTEKEYKNNPEYLASLIHKRDELNNLIETYLRQFNKCQSHDGRVRLKELIKTRKSELNTLDREINLREPKTSKLHDTISDKYTELNITDANIIENNNKMYMRTYDPNEIRRIIRNSFAHPGRIKIVKSDFEEYVVEITDVNDSGEVTSLGYCNLKDLLFFITQDETIYLEDTKQRSAA